MMMMVDGTLLIDFWVHIVCKYRNDGSHSHTHSTVGFG